MKNQQLGPYRIVRPLGRGGMGTVYEAVNVETDERAAVKLLVARLADSGSFRERFSSEIETLRKLRHPNIVRLFGFGEQDDELYYAMELVPGQSLEAELDQGRPFEWREVTRMAVQVCRALRHAHDRGVVHRDIKPANLLLTSDGTLKLSDFGIARFFGDTRLTRAGNVVGTAEFMSPEQAEGLAVTPRSDLYSLGVVLYVLLARRPLFQAKSVPELLQKHRYERPQPLRRHAPDVPAGLEAIIHQLLEKDPQKRPANARLLERQLLAMEQALMRGGTSPGDVAATEVMIGLGATDAGTEGPPDSDEAATLPPTVVTDALVRQQGEEAGSEPQREIPGTKATTAFEGVAVTTPVAAPEASGRFVPVAEDELDRPERPPAAVPWISPQTWGLLLCVVTMGLAAWYFLQPPSADSLYERIMAHADREEAGSLLEVEEEIHDFLLRFPDDPRRARLQEYEREIELQRRERKFALRARGLAGKGELLPIEQAYLTAVHYTELDPELGMVRLKALIDLYDYQADPSSPTGQCLELAKRRVDRLREQLARHRAQQRSLIRSRLEQADDLRTTDPERSRRMYEAVIELYQQQPWAVELVGLARDGLAQVEGVPGRSTND